MAPTRLFRAEVDWAGPGTREYRGYRRDHTVRVPGKAPIPATSALAPGSDPSHYSPEELVVGALSSCHMLWYLHLCSDAGVVVTAYHDEAEAELSLERGGEGRLVRATLRPRVTIAEGDPELARSLHGPAHERCFVASSVNFPVTVEATVLRADGRAQGAEAGSGRA